jgi:hypothetical protein
MKLQTIPLACLSIAAALVVLWGCKKEESGRPPASPVSPPGAKTSVGPAPGQPAPSAAQPTQPATAPVSMKPTEVNPMTAPFAATSPAAATAPPTAPPTPGGPKPPENPRVAAFAGLTAPKPATWLWQPPMRQFSIAEYVVPGRDGSDQAHITVFKSGGSVQDNITRWKTQFRNSDGSPVEPKLQTLEADGMTVTVVEFAGEYRGMGMPSFTPDQLFITGVVMAPDGQIFIRFVGPTATVESNREPFMDLLRGLKKAEPQK